MFLRIARSFVFIIISVVILGGGFFAGIYSYDYYWQWQNRQDLRNLVKSYEQARKNEEARKMADTFGGKTPQETLQMFIEAVEAGDYELASKYFVESKREEWRNSLNSTAKANKIDNFLQPIKLINKNINNNKDIPTNINNYYTIREPILVEFILYPNGIWKLTEI